VRFTKQLNKHGNSLQAGGLALHFAGAGSGGCGIADGRRQRDACEGQAGNLARRRVNDEAFTVVLDLGVASESRSTMISGQKPERPRPAMRSSGSDFSASAPSSRRQCCPPMSPSILAPIANNQDRKEDLPQIRSMILAVAVLAQRLPASSLEVQTGCVHEHHVEPR
jgi:hypothetical protein